MTTVPISDIQEYYWKKVSGRGGQGLGQTTTAWKLTPGPGDFEFLEKDLQALDHWFCDLFQEHRKSLAFPCLLLLGPIPQQMHPLILKKVLHVGEWLDVEEKSQHPGIFFWWSQEYSVESKPNCLSHKVPKGNSPPCWDSWTNWENINMRKMGWS